MKEIIKSDSTQMVVSEDYSSITVKDELSEIIDFTPLLGEIAQIISATNVVSKIKKGVEYVVSVPIEFRKGLADGSYFIMKNSETGVMHATLMEKLENGRNSFVTNLPIEEKQLIHGNPIQDICGNAYNICMQRQMAEISQMAQDTYDAVRRIERGQTDDRIGMLIAGKEEVLIGLQTHDEATIKSGRGKIITAQYQIGTNLRTKIEHFDALPNSKFGMYAKQLADSKYLMKKDNEYKDIENYFGLYLEATKLVAASCAVCGDVDAAYDYFDRSSDFLSAVDYTALKTIGNSHSEGAFCDAFYNHAEEYVVAEKNAFRENAEKCRSIDITVSGEKLLEVFENVR